MYLEWAFFSLYFGQTGRFASVKSRLIFLFFFFDLNYDWENDHNIDCFDRTQSDEEIISFLSTSGFLIYVLKSEICGNFSVYIMWKLFVHNLEKLQIRL